MEGAHSCNARARAAGGLQGGAFEGGAQVQSTGRAARIPIEPQGVGLEKGHRRAMLEHQFALQGACGRGKCIGGAQAQDSRAL